MKKVSKIIFKNYKKSNKITKKSPPVETTPGRDVFFRHIRLIRVLQGWYGNWWPESLFPLTPIFSGMRLSCD